MGTGNEMSATNVLSKTTCQCGIPSFGKKPGYLGHWLRACGGEPQSALATEHRDSESTSQPHCQAEHPSLGTTAPRLSIKEESSGLSSTVRPWLRCLAERT